MSVTSMKTNDDKRVELEIKVDAETFEKAVDAAFKRNSKRMNVPGFRRGKAPRKMIERLYGEGVFYEESVNNTYPAAYEDAVKQGQIKSGLINADGSANVYCLLIWSVSGTEDADKIVVRDAYIGREGTEPTATEPTGTEPTGTEPTGTEPTGTETTNTGATDTNGSVIEPTNTNGSTTDTTSKTGDSPKTGDNMAVAMVGAMVLAASAGLLVFSRKKA